MDSPLGPAMRDAIPALRSLHDARTMSSASRELERAHHVDLRMRARHFAPAHREAIDARHETHFAARTKMPCTVSR
jgi:hypothetical protein